MSHEYSAIHFVAFFFRYLPITAAMQPPIECDVAYRDQCHLRLREITIMSTVPGNAESTGTQSNDAQQPVATIDIEKLFREHRHHLQRFVERYVRNSDDAADVVQNTFVEAVRCAERFSGLSKPSTWLFGIALNLARNQVRRNCADLYETVDEAFIEQIADLHADPADLIERRQIADKVQALLEELPPKIRATFEAVLDGDATYEQAAEQLNIPVGTLRSRVSRVRATVRSRFG
jgi:RNA polymerase sigma factor (sigma-70 family)